MMKSGCFNYKFQILLYFDILGKPFQFLTHFQWSAKKYKPRLFEIMTWGTKLQKN